MTPVRQKRIRTLLREHPKDRVEWGTNFKKPKTQWVIVQPGAAA